MTSGTTSQQSLPDQPYFTLGVLTSGLEDQYHTNILRGAIAAAQEQNVNLIVYSGGELDSPVKDHVNGNVIYDLAIDPSIHAMILFTGTLVGFVDLERRVEFADRYSIPKVSIGISLANAHNVMLDNEFGMRAAIRHLIATHKHRRIAFVQGPEGNEEATARFQAYLDVLKEYDIPYDPQLVVRGKFQVEDGEEAVRVLIDERMVKVDAIVGANDNMAIGTLAAVQKRGISVPEQIAVIGFDDIDDAEALIPPLTTVRQPLYEQGKTGVELALALLRGENVANPLMLPPELVVRRSCGCFSPAVVHAETETVSADAIPVEQRLMDAKTLSIGNMLSVMPSTRNYQWMEQLYDAFLVDLLNNVRPEHGIQFISTLDSITRQLLMERVPIQGWHEVLSAMRREIIPLLGQDVQLCRHAENMWQQGRILIAEAIQHAEANKQLQGNIQAQALNAIGEPLLNVTNMSDLTTVMSEGLPMLGVKSCLIALYEDTSLEKARLIFSYTQDFVHTSVAVTGDHFQFPSKTLISQTLLSRNQRNSLLVEALHFDNTQFGFIVLGIEQAQAHIYEALRKQISSALHTASIMQQLEEKHSLLETAMHEVKTTQALLIHSEKMNALGQMVAGVAHEINNPIAFVTSNVHSLSTTFEELVTAYDSLEKFAGAQQDNAAELARMRQQADLDYLTDDTKDLITQTLNGLKRVKDIVTELRKFSRLDEAEFKISNLRENIESTVLVASGELRNRVTVEVEIDPALELRCAAAELNQVFLNIIVNAAQAIQDTGTISIAANEEGSEVVITFSDTGAGIPEHVMEHIFDPFFTTKPVGIGTGLGLSIAHKIIVEMHHGSISVESNPGQGTKFTIRLPKEGHS